MQTLLSPRELGDAIGASESSIKRWVDEQAIRATRTKGGHRRIAVSDAVQYIRQQQLPVLKPQALGIDDLKDAGSAEDLSEIAPSVFQQALLSGQAARARGVLLSMYLSGTPVAEICDGLVAEAMHRIGRIWRHDKAGIFMEHRATDICLQALNQLRVVAACEKDQDWVAVGGAGATDPYALPSVMADTVLSSQGWRTVNLGPQTPLHILPLAAEQTGARLVWLSLSVGENKRDTLKNVLSTAEDLARIGVRLVTGGRAVPEALRKAANPKVFVGSSMAELVAFARGLQASGA